LTLSNADEHERQKAIDFVKSIIEAVAPWQPPVIIGSMQGRASSADEIGDCRKRLASSLLELTEYAKQFEISVLIEPLNRYETNLLNTVEDGLNLIQAVGTDNLKLLCDIFHMNIEEAAISTALLAAGNKLGHVHFADSNRSAVGFGHINYAPIIAALSDMGYSGYLSAEVFAKPDPETAAKQTHLAFQSLCGTRLRDSLTG
jgi:sugar phosphate isomerase/epimerase